MYISSCMYTMIAMDLPPCLVIWTMEAHKLLRLLYSQRFPTLPYLSISKATRGVRSYSQWGKGLDLTLSHSCWQQTPLQRLIPRVGHEGRQGFGVLRTTWCNCTPQFLCLHLYFQQHMLTRSSTYNFSGLSVNACYSDVCDGGKLWGFACAVNNFSKKRSFFV